MTKWQSLLPLSLSALFSGTLVANEKTWEDYQKEGLPRYAYDIIESCNNGDAIKCQEAALLFEIPQGNDVDQSKEFRRKACIAAGGNPHGTVRAVAVTSCKIAGMAIGGELLSDLKREEDAKREAASKLDAEKVGNWNNGTLEAEVDVPLTVESIQEALDVVFLTSQGRSASDKALNDCKVNDGCAAVAGIVRARWKIVEVQDCSMRVDDLVSCQFTYRAESASTLSPNESYGNRFLDGVTGMAIGEADTLLRLENGKWRFIPL